MIKMIDIYYKVNTNIMNSNFLRADIDEQKELIDKEIKNYLNNKVSQIRPKIQLEKNNNLSISELLDILADKIPEKKHPSTLKCFTHFILETASGLQGSNIEWIEEDDPSLIDNPVTEFDENGRWISITTHEKTKCLTTCNLVHDAFKNNFMVKKGIVKKLGSIPSNK